MGEVEILHRIFTNAAEEGPFEKSGARIVAAGDRDLERASPPHLCQAVDALLGRTAPAGHEMAYAALRYMASGKETYGCLVVSCPDLVSDAHGRAGFLNHARLVRVSEPSFDAVALYETAFNFPYTDVHMVAPARRVRSYVEFVSEDVPVLLRPVTAAELQDLSRELLRSFLVACLGNLGAGKSVRVDLPNVDPSRLVRAWAALPLALQRKSSWAVGMESCPVDVVFTRSNGKAVNADASSALMRCVDHYLDLLHARPEKVDAIMHDSALRSVADLDEAVHLSRKKIKPGPAAQPGPRVIPADAVAEWNRQGEAMEVSVRRYIDDRFAALGEMRQSAVPAEPVRTRGKALVVLMSAALVVSLASAVAAGYVLWEYEGARRPDGPATTSMTAATVEPPPDLPGMRTITTPAHRAIEKAERTANWTQEFKLLLESDGAFVAQAVASIADGARGPARVELKELAERIGRNEELRAEERMRLRALLLECIADKAASGAFVTINGDVSELRPLVDELKTRYGVTTADRDPSSMNLQSEIILRWMAVDR